MFSWTAVRCQKFDETVEESSPIDDEPPATVPKSSTDWCDDADAWNSDDDDDGSNNNDKNNEEKPSFVPTTTKTQIKKEPEVTMMNSMKIDDENEHENEKSSSDEDDDDETETQTKKKKKNVSVASSDAFSEWKKTNLTKQTLDVPSNATFPFYYIVNDDEDDIINEAKLNEQKKLKNKIKKLGDIDEDEDDETMKGGKEYVSDIKYSFS